MRISTTQTKQPITLTPDGDVTLHRLVETTIDIDALTNTESIIYHYDKVSFNTPYTATLQSQLESNFDTWFKYGLADEKRIADRETKLKQVRVLINEGKQPEVNASLELRNTVSFVALMELHMIIFDLSMEIENLKAQIAPQA